MKKKVLIGSAIVGVVLAALAAVGFIVMKDALEDDEFDDYYGY
jgi:hypothetical protein